MEKLTKALRIFGAACERLAEQMMTFNNSWEVNNAEGSNSRPSDV